MVKRLLLAICAGAALVPAGAGATRSDVICVGGGTGCLSTIAAAVAAAHDGDTITVAKGTFAGGVVIDKSIKLVGAGASRTTVKGGGPVITIGRSNLSKEPTVAIQGITITGGRTATTAAGTCGPDIPTCGPGYPKATALGGGIEVVPAAGGSLGATVTIADSLIVGNRAAPSTTVSSVRANCPGGPCPFAQGAGGGIDNWGTMTLRNTTVSNNQAGGPVTAQADGGGIADERGAHLTLDHSTVARNRAIAPAPNGRFADGGGIYVDSGGTLVLRSSTVDSNASTLSSTFPKSVTSDSHASTGGVFVGDHGTATVDATSIRNNIVRVTDPNGQPVGFDPGMLVSGGSSSLVMRASKVSGNRLIVTVGDSGAGASGGGLEADGNATISKTQITGNSVKVTSRRGLAAGVAVVNMFDGGSRRATISDSVISGNSVTVLSTSGSATVQGIGLANNGPLLLRNVTIADNTATATASTGWVHGGGVFNGLVFPQPHPVLTLEHSKITHNTVRAGRGLTVQDAGIYTKDFPAHIGNSEITGNSPDQCFGC